MPFSCNTRGFPSISSYAEAKAHYDRTDPWRRPDEVWPGKKIIGHQCSKHARKTMRELEDGSIAFRLYDTDCVTWHPNNRITIRGWSSPSTTEFVGMLTPAGISHGQGRKNEWEPILYLYDNGRPPWETEESYTSYREKVRPWYARTQIIQCSQPVTLYEVDGRWLPIDDTELEPFRLYRFDRRASRAAAAKYHLKQLEGVIDAAIALSGGTAHPPATGQRTGGGVQMGAIMAALEQEQYLTAIGLMPRGGGSYKFGRKPVSDRMITPGFLMRLRNHIYEHEGAVERYEQTRLTPAQYKKFCDDERRFG